MPFDPSEYARKQKEAKDKAAKLKSERDAKKAELDAEAAARKAKLDVLRGGGATGGPFEEGSSSSSASSASSYSSSSTSSSTSSSSYSTSSSRPSSSPSPPSIDSGELLTLREEVQQLRSQESQRQRERNSLLKRIQALEDEREVEKKTMEDFIRTVKRQLEQMSCQGLHTTALHASSTQGSALVSLNVSTKVEATPKSAAPKKVSKKEQHQQEKEERQQREREEKEQIEQNERAQKERAQKERQQKEREQKEREQKESAQTQTEKEREQENQPSWQASAALDMGSDVDEIPLGGSQQNDPFGEDAFAATDEPQNMVTCHGCDRTFNEKAMKTHAKICKKVFQTKRKAFKINFLETEDGQPIKKKPEPKKTEKQLAKEAEEKEKKVPKWKIQRDQLRAAMKAGKEVQKAIAEGRDLSTLPPPPVNDALDDRVACPKCGRKFAEDTAARHIPKCNAKAKPASKPAAKKR